MIHRYAQPGQVAGLWVRPTRLVPPEAVLKVEVEESGLAGDHGRPGKRAVTLIQAEHLAVIGAMMGRSPIAPALVRRNVVVAGINLSALKGRRLKLGTALIEITTVCAPCSRMEKALGPGGFSAMRGHGGWCARVVMPGILRVGDEVAPESDAEPEDGHD